MPYSILGKKDVLNIFLNRDYVTAIKVCTKKQTISKLVEKKLPRESADFEKWKSFVVFASCDPRACDFFAWE